MASKSS